MDTCTVPSYTPVLSDTQMGGVEWSGVGCEGTYLLRNADGALRLWCEHDVCQAGEAWAQAHVWALVLETD